MYLKVPLIICMATFVHANPASPRTADSDSTKEHKSELEKDSVLLKTLRFISFLVDDQESDKILTATESKRYYSPEDILSVPLVAPSDVKPVSRRKRSKQQSFDLFEIIPYIPEEIPWSNQAYKNPAVYGGGWGTHHYHPVVLLKN